MCPPYYRHHPLARPPPRHGAPAQREDALTHDLLAQRIGLPGRPKASAAPTRCTDGGGMLSISSCLARGTAQSAQYSGLPERGNLSAGRVSSPPSQPR